MEHFNFDSEEHSYYKTYTLPSKFMLTVEYQLDADWGKGSGPHDVAANICILTSKKRKHISENSYGLITGPGGFDVYLTVKKSIEDFTEAWLAEYGRGYRNLRLHASGYNKRLDDAYRKVLPRLGFYPYHRGYFAMEKIITPDGNLLSYDYASRLQEISNAQAIIDTIVSEAEVGYN